MRRASRLWLVLTATALAGGVVAARASPCWRAWVVAVVETIDGDTVDLEVSWEPAHVVTERVRLLGVDTPEVRGPTREAGLAAKAYTAAWLADSGPTELVVCRPARDAFGRLLGRVVSLSKGDLGASLLATGHAVPYDPRDPRK
jgi:micrococcal nuclease